MLLFEMLEETVNNMTLLSDFAKAFLYLTVAVWIFTIIGTYIVGFTIFALILTIGFLVPLSMIVYGYFQDRKKVVA